MGDTRQRILDAARRLTHQHGYAAASIGDVAAEAGIAKGNLVYHFPTRHALMAALAEDRAGRLATLIARWEADCAGIADCLGRIVDLMESEADLLAKHGCPQGTMAAELGKADPDLRAAGMRGLDLLIGFAARKLATRLPEDEARAEAEDLVAALEGAVLLAHGYGDPNLVRRHTARIRARLVRTYG